ENGFLRAQEDHSVRRLQDAMKQIGTYPPCCPQFAPNCKLSICGFSLDSYMVGTEIWVTFAFALCCGNIVGEEVCEPYWTADIVTPGGRLYPFTLPGELICYDSACYHVYISPYTGVPCGDPPPKIFGSLGT